MIERKASWQLRGLCRGTDNPNAYFSSKVADSKKSCKGCPVMDLCKTYAIAHAEYGIWGGTSRYERQRLPEIYRDLIRNLYYDQGLLEYRPWLQEWLEQREGQQQGQSFPIVRAEAS